MCISHDKKDDEELKAVIRAYLSAKIVTVCSSNMCKEIILKFFLMDNMT